MQEVHWIHGDRFSVSVPAPLWAKPHPAGTKLRVTIKGSPSDALPMLAFETVLTEPSRDISATTNEQLPLGGYVYQADLFVGEEVYVPGRGRLHVLPPTTTSLR